MDEMNESFPIPGKGSMFSEGDAPAVSALFQAFDNPEGNKAVVLATVDAMADEGEEHLSQTELKSYAEEIMNGGDDYRELQIGDIYEGETAKADADSEATRLDEEYNPGDGASIDELVSAIDSARGDTTVEEENALAEAEAEPPSFGAPDTLLEKEEKEDMEGEDEMPEEPALPPVEDEPMLEQLKKAKKP